MGGGWARWLMAIKEGTCYNEHWVLYISNESLNSTPETDIASYANSLECTYFFEKKKKIYYLNLKRTLHRIIYKCRERNLQHTHTYLIYIFKNVNVNTPYMNSGVLHKELGHCQQTSLLPLSLTH